MHAPYASSPIPAHEEPEDDAGQPWSLPVWAEALRARTNASLRVPRRVDDAELFRVDAPGDVHWVLRRNATGRYLRLDASDRFVWERLNGESRVLDIAKAFTAEFGQMGLFRVLAAVEMFDNAEMLSSGAPDRVWGPVRFALHRRTLAGRLSNVNRTLLFRRWPVSGLAGFFDRCYRYLGRVFFTPFAVLAMIIFSAVGTVTWLGIDHPRPSTLSMAQFGVVSCAVVLSLGLHELGHALAVRHFGFRVDRAGLMLMYGTPGAFVDTSDMWLGNRRQRLSVTATGPLVNLVLGSVATFLVTSGFAVGNTTLSAVATSQFLLVLANATPLLKLDGYYLLMDATGVSNLRERSILFIGKPLANRFREAWKIGDILPSLPREERYLFAYGMAYTLWLLLVGLAGLLVLPVRLWRTGANAAAVGTTSVFGAVLATGVFLIMAFGLLQLFAARIKIMEMVTMLGRRVDRSTPPGGLVLTAVVVAVLGLLVPALAATRSSVAHTLWADVLPAVAAVAAARRSWETALGARGSVWRTVFGGCAAAATLLGAAETCALFDFRIGSVFRALGIAVVITSFVSGRRLALGALGGSLIACWVPVLIGVVFSAVPGGPTHLGTLSIASGLIVGARILRRPFTDRRQIPDIPLNEPPGGAREVRHLRRGFTGLAEHLARQMAELFGESHRIAFITAANTAAVDAGWPLWFVQEGQLVDRVEADIGELAAIYRSVLARFVEVAGSACDPTVAVEAVVEARLLLPARLGRLVDEHLGSALERFGRPSLTIDLDDPLTAVRFTLRHMVRTLARCVDETAGGTALEGIIGAANRHASRNGWGIWCRANGQLADDSLLRAVEPERIAAGFLAVVCSATAEHTGVTMAQRSVQFSVDTLPRDLHPTVEPMLAGSPWASGPSVRKVRATSPRRWPVPTVTVTTADRLTAATDVFDHEPVDRRGTMVTGAG